MKQTIYITVATVLLLLGASCTKEAAQGLDPYAGGRQPLGIVFPDEPTAPSRALPGDEMTFKVFGVDWGGSDVKFYVNEMLTEVVHRTDSTITVVLPQGVSTGVTRVVVDGQIFPGPIANIVGKVSIDGTFRSGIGTNGPIYTVFQHDNSSPVYLGGSFSDYNGASAGTTINGLVRITAGGDFVTGMQFGDAVGSGGVVRTIARLSDGDLMIGGAFEQYRDNQLINNITRISNTGLLRTETVDILNITEDPDNGTMVVPTYNGGAGFRLNLGGGWSTGLDVGGAVRDLYVRGTGTNTKITAVGSFSSYISRGYENSTVDDILTDFFPINAVLRTSVNGDLDNSYLVNNSIFPPEGYRGIDGFVDASHMNQTNGQLILAGRFSLYYGADNTALPVGNMIRLNEDGSVDAGFGASANGAVSYLAALKHRTGKYFVAGQFSSFNGAPVNQLVIMNEDGSVDPSFTARRFEGGSPTFVYEMVNGRILVGGSFNRYDGVIRQGFMVLNSDGSLAEEYNNTGSLDGRIYSALEVTNSLGQNTVILAGLFSTFNGVSNIGNIMRLTFED